MTSLFIHNPRTAGTSMRNSLYGTDVVFLLPHSKQDTAIARSIPNAKPIGGRSQHMPLAEMRSIWGAPFDTFFKFVFVRDPVERLVSWWRHMHAAKTRFDEYVVDKMDRDWIPEQNIFTHSNGKQAVDFIGRFSHLQEDWVALCCILEIDPDPLSCENRSHPVAYLLADQFRRRIESKFATDYELLSGYF